METKEELASQVSWRLAQLYRLYGKVGQGPRIAGALIMRTCGVWDAFKREAGLDRCQCETGLPPGILWPWAPEGAEPPAGWSWVERCDECRRFSSDAHAAGALLAAGIGTEVRWFARDPGHRHEPSRPEAPGCSCAIDVGPDFPLGVRFELTVEIERDGFVAAPGLTGVVTAATRDVIELRMDRPLPGAEDDTVRFAAPPPDEPWRHPLAELLEYAAAIGATDEDD